MSEVHGGGGVAEVREGKRGREKEVERGKQRGKGRGGVWRKRETEKERRGGDSTYRLLYQEQFYVLFYCHMIS